MWRFIEEGPLLKFPLRESPFMAADPMYRDVVIAPPIRFQKIALAEQTQRDRSFTSDRSVRDFRSSSTSNSRDGSQNISHLSGRSQTSPAGNASSID